MASVEDCRLEGGRAELKQMTWNSEYLHEILIHVSCHLIAAAGIMQEYTNHEKMKTSYLCSVCVYEEGAILATHIDCLPLASSAIIDVDELPL